MAATLALRQPAALVELVALVALQVQPSTSRAQRVRQPPLISTVLSSSLLLVARVAMVLLVLPVVLVVQAALRWSLMAARSLQTSKTPVSTLQVVPAGQVM